MKLKIFIILLLLLSGAWVIWGYNPKNETDIDKSYKSVDEYEKAMYEVQKQYPAFKFSVYKFNDSGKHKNIGYVKNNKWIEKFDVIPMFNEYFFSDGNKVYFHKTDGNNKEINFPVQLTTQYNLTKWNSAEVLSTVKSKSFTNQNANINGMPCRMINYEYNNGNKAEVCISDKYGVAVFYKFEGYRNFDGKVRDKKLYSERIEVYDIDTKDLSDSIFQ